MEHYEELVQSLLTYDAEEEWFDFKTNWYEPHALGEYISAISNAAAMNGREAGYIVWGVTDDRIIVGTQFSYQRDYKNEPLQHYLARQVTPDIGFTFHELFIQDKRIVLLAIPAAVKIPTAFDGIRYIRIGSSKENVAKYPEREAQLFDVLRHGLPTVGNTPSEYQDLSFGRLFTYYAGRGITLRQDTFKKNLGLLLPDGRYNLLALLLSDNDHMPVRVSIFRGKTKSDPLFSIKEFGNTCILLTVDRILEYGDVINLIQVDERDRIVERKETRLFDQDSFREAVLNAFIHNKWVDGNAPMITIYSDRIEILSRGTLAPQQTMEGFFAGESVPVNQRLSDIFLQLHISERSGRGVPKITDSYGKKAFTFRQNSIVVTIPFAKKTLPLTTLDEHAVGRKTGKENNLQQKILLEMRNNPNVTQPQLAEITGYGKTTIQKNITVLKKSGYLERIGSNKRGYWHVLK